MSITRKGRENYCFVSFDDADEAREFMARHNHQLLREYDSFSGGRGFAEGSKGLC